MLNIHHPKRAYPNFGDHCERQSPKAEKQLTENCRTNSPKRPRNWSPAVSFLFTRVCYCFALLELPLGPPGALKCQKTEVFWDSGRAEVRQGQNRLVI